MWLLLNLMRPLHWGWLMSTNVLVKSLAVFGVGILCSPAAHATTITVENLGSIQRQRLAPSTKTPGTSKTFEDFFEFLGRPPNMSPRRCRFPARSRTGFRRARGTDPRDGGR